MHVPFRRTVLPYIFHGFYGTYFIKNKDKYYSQMQQKYVKLPQKKNQSKLAQKLLSMLVSLDTTGTGKTKWRLADDSVYITQNQGQNRTTCEMTVPVLAWTYAELLFEWQVSSEATHDYLYNIAVPCLRQKIILAPS